jgi:hypothetical protein
MAATTAARARQTTPVIKPWREEVPAVESLMVASFGRISSRAEFSE